MVGRNQSAGETGEVSRASRHADVGDAKSVVSRKSTRTGAAAHSAGLVHSTATHSTGTTHNTETAHTPGAVCHTEPARSIEAAHNTKTAHSATTRDHVVPALTVLASGSGTTFQAVIDAVASGQLPWRVNLLVVDRPGTGAAERAAVTGIPVRVIDRANHRGPDRSAGLSDALSRAIPDETDLVLLAGFLSIVTEPLLTRFHRRMINLHPALLPEFGGAGMYGRHVHEAVLAAGRKQTGCTVHYVDAGTDTGEILLHRRIPVLPEDTPNSLARRLRPVEHRAVIDALLTLAPEVR